MQISHWGKIKMSLGLCSFGRLWRRIHPLSSPVFRSCPNSLIYGLLLNLHSQQWRVKSSSPWITECPASTIHLLKPLYYIRPARELIFPFQDYLLKHIYKVPFAMLRSHMLQYQDSYVDIFGKILLCLPHHPWRHFIKPYMPRIKYFPDFDLYIPWHEYWINIITVLTVGNSEATQRGFMICIKPFNDSRG